MRIIEGSPIISYPTKWEYRLIGHKKETIVKAVDKLLETEDYKLEESNRSSGGKYVSVNLIMTVNTEDERDSIFRRLKNHSDILMVL